MQLSGPIHVWRAARDVPPQVRRGGARRRTMPGVSAVDQCGQVMPSSEGPNLSLAISSTRAVARIVQGAF